MTEREAAAARGAPPWTFARSVALAATVGGLVLLVWLVLIVKDVVLLTMLAVLFAVLLDGGVRALRTRVQLPRWSALLLLWLAFVLLLLGGTLALAPQVAADMARLASRIPQAFEQMESAVKDTPLGREAVEQLTKLQESGSLREAAGRFLGFFSSVLGAVSGMLVVLVLGVFIASEPDAYVQGSLRLLPPPSRGRAREIAKAMGRALRWWLIGRLASMAVVFLLSWIGLMLLGMPLAFLLALIAGLLSFVPTFGPVASAVPAILVGLSIGPQHALWVAFLYLGVQLVESYGITPFIQRQAVRLPPALLVIFQLMMGVLAGVLGVLLATPILVVVMVLVGTLYLEDAIGEGVDLP